MNKYEECGVSIASGNLLVSRIADICKETYNSNVIEGIGQFCSLYRISEGSEYLIASSTDGVGTKVLLAQQLSEYGYLSTIGLDLVGMVVNDIITCGAKPLFLLDYYACSNLKQDSMNEFSKSEKIIQGIATGCKIAGCALIGGETSEMPDMYDEKKFDLASFGIGLVMEKDLLGPHLVKSGDKILGVESSGPHSNGYSLIRQIYYNFDWKDNEFDTRRSIMAPTHIYSKLVQKILERPNHGIHAMAHITGGGLEYNTKRSVPENLGIQIDWTSFPRHSIFRDIQGRGKLEEQEMREVFNCGIGYTIICSPEKENEIRNFIEASFGIRCFSIGNVE